MALLFMDGFDRRDPAQKWVSVGGDYSLITATRFNAGYAFRSNWGGIGNLTKKYTPSTTIIVGLAVKTFGSDSGEFMSLYGDNGTTPHLTLSYNIVGAINIYRGAINGTLLGSGSCSLAGWGYVEVFATNADSGGVVTVRVNGSEIFTYTGDTRNGGTVAKFDAIRIGNPNRGAGYDYDDLYICDTTGTTNNAFLGDVRVQTIVPTAAGSSTQLAPTGGANYANVAESPDSTATYNSSSTVGERDTYVMSDLASGTTSVYGIQDNIAAWKADAGTGNIKAALKVGSTVYYDPTVSLGTSAGAWNGAVRETNPATSTAWTPSDVNGIEFGAEVA